MRIERRTDGLDEEVACVKFWRAAAAFRFGFPVLGAMVIFSLISLSRRVGRYLIIAAFIPLKQTWRYSVSFL
jgi:hypothetical protein